MNIRRLLSSFIPDDKTVDIGSSCPWSNQATCIVFVTCCYVCFSGSEKQGKVT